VTYHINQNGDDTMKRKRALTL